jgi:hypothetical protein
MTELENVLYLLVQEIRGLRADLKLSTQKKLLLEERLETDRTVKRLVGLHNKRQTNGDC